MSAKRIRKVDLSYFEKIDTQEKAYFLGLMYADGYNLVGRYFILSLHFKDVDILFKFKKALKSTAKIVRRVYKRKDDSNKLNDYVCFQVNSSKMTKDLERHGCMKAKTHLIRFPFHIKKILWRHFIRGYFDGDGGLSAEKNKYVNHTKYRANIVSNPKFIDDLNSIFYKVFGKKYYILKHKRHKYTEQIRIEGNPSIENFLNWLYKDATVYLDRKYNLYQLLLDRVNQWNRPIKVYDKLTKKLIGHYPSIKSAADNIKMDPASLCNQLNGKHESRKFIYKDSPWPKRKLILI